MGLPCDWQVNIHKIAERTQYLLETGQWSDCKFIVGQEPHQQTFKGHKLFLAMSSPVFEAMFFGEMAEKNDPIPIRDVQPEAFKAFLKYIYTDKVDLGKHLSDQATASEVAYELYYCAKKYMISSLVEECIKFLKTDLSPKKACKTYEFAKLFEEPVLMEKCLQIIRTETNEVLKESSWEEVELGTLTTVLEQADLQINSELVLFTALERWAKAECARKSLDASDEKSLKSVIGNALSKIRFLSLTPHEFAQGVGTSQLLTKDEKFAIIMSILCSGSKAAMPEGFSINSLSRAKPVKAQAETNGSLFMPGLPTTPQPSSTPRGLWHQTSTNCFGAFPVGGGSNNRLRHSPPRVTENVVRKENGNLPANSSPSVVIEGGTRGGDTPKYYCLRTVVDQTHCLNTDVLDCSVTFSVDRNICVLGVQVPTQITGVANSINHAFDPNRSYTEILYAHLLDSDDTRLTYTHFTTRVHIGTLVEITFDRPVYIQKHKIYRVGVVFNKVGWYPMGVCAHNIMCDSVFFSFGVGNRIDSVRDGLIRSIVFSHH